MRQQLLLIMGLLALAALSACSSAPTPQMAASPIEYRAEDGWGPLPTRIPTPTPFPASYFLQPVAPALRAGELAIAQTAWEQAYALAPDDAEVLREGARLALAQADLVAAEARAWAALGADEASAETWMLLGTIQLRRSAWAEAGQSLQLAEALDPALADALFPSRWQIALQYSDAATLATLAQRYFMQQPEDPLAPYYRAEALLVDGKPQVALELLLLEMNADAPAVLWYTLGRVYLALGNANEQARIALETAAMASSRGDRTLSLASAAPQRDLNAALAQAYIRLYQCAKAEAQLRLLVTPYPELAELHEEAVRCVENTPGD